MKAMSFTRLLAAASCLACVIATVAVAAPPRTGPGPIDPTLPVERPVRPALPALPGPASMMIESRLGFMIDTPLLAFNNTGVLTYTTANGLLTVSADPLAMLLSAGNPPVLIFPTAGGKVVEIGVSLAGDGSLVGGVPGDDLLVTGRVDLGGGDVRDGTLLTGEVTEYMGENGSGTTDFHSFRFTVTGGLLNDIFGSDVAIELTSEMSNFTGNYAVNFSGEAKGNIGVVECTGTIGDFVWLDLDGNGIQDDGEDGIKNVQLILTDADGNTTTAVTNGAGFYQFSGLCAGTYTVMVNPDSLPADVDITLINAPGSNDANDSNDPAGTTVTLPQNDSMDQDTDFGYVPVTASLGDYVWEDLDMDGINDGNEPPIEGVMVNLYD
ncbi:MAG: hypothetical protein KJO35_07270, partial [Gammaproteobacteria bacterium]|nr:hypothetical protein [Gammaproteobacteria bacterium]